jgi:hypothetical protein
MKIELTETTTIARPASEVRDRFRDITYHAANPVGGVAVSVLQRRGGRCRYLTSMQLGPFTFDHEVVMTEEDDGSLRHVARQGRFAGAVATCRFRWIAPETTAVTLTARIPTPMTFRPVTPLLRRWLSRTLRDALADERVDLEQPRPARLPHPSLL